MEGIRDFELNNLSLLSLASRVLNFFVLKQSSNDFVTRNLQNVYDCASVVRIRDCHTFFDLCICKDLSGNICTCAH